MKLYSTRKPTEKELFQAANVSVSLPNNKNRSESERYSQSSVTGPAASRLQKPVCLSLAHV